MTSAPAPTASWRTGRGRWVGVLLSAVWLLFLAEPLRAVLDLERAWARGAGIAALVVFAGAYLAVFARRRLFGAFTPDDDGRHDRPGAYATLGPLVVALVVLAGLVGDRAAGLTVFVVAAGAIELTTGRSLAVLGGMVAATAIIAVQRPEPGTVLVPVLCVVTWLSLWFSRRVVSDNAKLRRAEGELAAMRVVAERERVARDVHDILGHTLTVLTIKTQVADRLIDSDPGRAHAEMAEIQRLTRSALSDVRATVTQLRVPGLAEQLAATRTVLRAAGVDLLVQGDLAAVPEERRPLLAWALREATTNIVRHADAGRVHVRLRPDGLEITDDGVGVGDAEGNGITGLRERARAAGAEVDLAPHRPGHARPGTRLEVAYA